MASSSMSADLAKITRVLPAPTSSAFCFLRGCTPTRPPSSRSALKAPFELDTRARRLPEAVSTFWSVSQCILKWKKRCSKCTLLLQNNRCVEREGCSAVPSGRYTLFPGSKKSHDGCWSSAAARQLSASGQMVVTAVAIYNAKLAVVDVEAECFLASKSYGDCTVTKATLHFPTFPSVFLLLLLALGLTGFVMLARPEPNLTATNPRFNGHRCMTLSAAIFCVVPYSLASSPHTKLSER